MRNETTTREIEESGHSPSAGIGKTSSSKTRWLAIGAVAGFFAASLLPTEPAMAQVVNGSEKFAMISTPTAAGQAEAVFVLDYLTGRLVGVSYNSQAGIFTQRYFRNVVPDFDLSGDTDPQFVILPAFLNPQLRGVPRATPATGGIYVGELTSGRINVYGFNYRNASRPIADVVQIALLDQFEFRQSSEL